MKHTANLPCVTTLLTVEKLNSYFVEKDHLLPPPPNPVEPVCPDTVFEIFEKNTYFLCVGVCLCLVLLEARRECMIP